MLKYARRTAAMVSLSAVALAPALPAGAATARPADAGGRSVSLAGTAKNTAVIHCAIKADNPHYSHHAHAKNKHIVNAVGRVKCDHRVASIRIKIILFKNGNKEKYKETGWKSNTGKSSISHNAARRCLKNVRYMTAAYAYITAPPGYKPHTVYVKDYSSIVLIRKCKK